MNNQEVAAVRDKQDADRYDWLQGFFARKDIPVSKRRAIVNHIRTHREVMIIDRRQHSRGMKLVDSDGDEIEENVDVFSIVSMPHPEYSMCWFYSIKEAHDYCLTIGVMPMIHIYDLPTSTN